MNKAFKAMASEPRRRILNHLAGGPMTVGEIAENFDMALPSISKHLSVLKDAGLVHEQKRGSSLSTASPRTISSTRSTDF